MTQQFLNPASASPNDKLGDTPNSASNKINENFTELYEAVTLQSQKLTICVESDFPTQDGTSISLEDGFLYEVVCPITTSKYFKCLGGELTGIISTADFLVYTGSGDMFSAEQSKITVKNTTVSAPNGNILKVVGDGTKSLAYRVNADNVAVNSCLTFAKASNGGVLVLRVISATGTYNSSAIELSGTGAALQSIVDVAIIGLTATGTALDLGSTVNDEIEISNLLPIGDAAATCISGLANSGNITVGNKMSVAACNFTPFTTPLSGIQVNDVRMDFIGNPPLANSRNAGDMYLDGGTETITVATAGVFYEIGTPAIATWLGDIADRFTVNANGYIEYIGEAPLDCRITGRVTVEKVGGGSDVLEIRLAKNWTAGDSGETKTRAGSRNSNPTTIPTGGLISLVEGDNIRVIFANIDGTANILAAVTSLEITG